MEMLVVVGFFIICASICVLVFVKADNISKDARDINRASLEAQSLAEMMKAGVEPRWTKMMPSRDDHPLLYSEGTDSVSWEETVENIKKARDFDGLRAIYWDSAWQIMDPESSPEYIGVIAQGTVDGMLKAAIRIYRYGEGKLLYHLDTETYQMPDAPDNISTEGREDDPALFQARRILDEMKAGGTPPWSQVLPSRDTWSYLQAGESEGVSGDNVMEEIRKAPDYSGGMIYWDSSWQITVPDTAPEYLGLIARGTVDGVEKADIRIYKYGSGSDKGELLCHLTDTYQKP